MNGLREQMTNVLILVCSVFIVGFGYLLNDAERDARIKQSETARVALCSFRADLKGRHDRAVEFIDDVREGRRPPIPGITLTDLQRSVDSQREALESLRALDCSA